MTNTITTNKLFEEPAYNDQGWDVPVSTNFSIMDFALGSNYTIALNPGTTANPYTLATPSAFTSVPVTSLTAPNWWVAQQWTITSAGAFTTNYVIQIPAGVGGAWIIQNNISTANQGNYTLTLKVVGGSATVSLASGSISFVYSNGTNVYVASNVGGASGGGSDQIFWNNGQTVNTSYTIPLATNAGTFGPITIASGATVTIQSTSTWTVV
jgi:hypothetical protein